MVDQINGFINNFGLGITLSATDVITVAASSVLFFAAKPLSQLLRPNVDIGTRVSMMRTLNLLIILAVLIKARWSGQWGWLEQLANSLIVIYFAVVVAQIINYLIRRRFGKPHTVNQKLNFSDTYASRGLNLIATITIAVIALVSCLRILGLDSLLEAGGAIGIIGLILAMTQASWAPDIISGLIILNSRFCEDGDVIQFNMEGKPITASVFKTKIFHTEVLDLANNHRIMVRNAKLRDYGVQNLSRFASAKGLREVLYFNIDYQHSEEEVTQMILRAFEKIDQAETAREEQYDPEIRVHNTGDYAVTWAVYYYIKDVKRLLAIRQAFRGHILAEATASNISLATPDLHQTQVSVLNRSSQSNERII